MRAAVVAALDLFAAGPVAAEPFKYPRTGGAFTFGQEANVNSLDQMTSNTVSTRNIAMNVFEALTTRDENNPIPGLADSLAEAPDHMAFTFKLRPGVKFHNGKPMTSACRLARPEAVHGPPPLPSRGRCGARTYDRANGQDARTTINVSSKPRTALKANAVSHCTAVVTGRRNKAWFSGSSNAASTMETRVIAMATRPKSVGPSAAECVSNKHRHEVENARDKARTDQQQASKSCPAAYHVKTNPHLMSKIPPLAPSAWNPARATCWPTRAHLCRHGLGLVTLG